MANGTDFDEFMVLSTVRTGLKREFAFAVKSQSQISGSPGRTRSRNPQNGAIVNDVSEDSNNKRLKTSGSEVKENDSNEEQIVSATNEENNEVCMVEDDDEMKSDVVDSISDDEPKNHAVKSVDKEEFKGDAPEPMHVEGTSSDGVTLMSDDEPFSNLGSEEDLKNNQTFPDDSSISEQAKKEEEIMPCNLVDNSNVEPDKPVRRFTRLSLISKAKPEVPAVKDEDRKENFMGSSSLYNPPASKKFPARLKELLDTGILDGLHVSYVRSAKMRGQGGLGLRGMIKGSGILCYCKICKGIEVVSPNQFELHAGSSNKRPPEYTYLENGNTLRDVMNACKDASLDSLEEALQMVLGCSSVKKSNTCLNCRGSSSIGDSWKRKLVCNSCIDLHEHQAKLETKHPQASPDTKEFGDGSETKELAILDLDESGLSPSLSHDSDSRPLAPISDSSSSARRLKRSSSRSQSQGSKSKGRIRSSRSQSQGSKSKGSQSQGSNSKGSQSQGSNSKGRITKKDLRLHKLVFEEDVLPDGTEVAYYARGQKLLVGYKKGIGIYCTCCKQEVSPSQFEAHAGWASRRKPYLHIYTSNGVSLHELSISLSKDRISSNDNDDLCTICADGGDLLCCDGCPRAFHTECVCLPIVPNGRWYCKYCLNMFQKEKFVERNINAVAAGRVAGVDPIEEITNRCIRIVNTPEAESGGCVLCREHNFSKEFGPKTVILCDQCEKEYHVGCLKNNMMDDLKELPRGKWFCCKGCNNIHAALQKLVLRGEEKLPESLVSVIKKRYKEIGSESSGDLDIRWRLLSGKFASDGNRALLSRAVSIFHESFDPIIDSASKRDLIPAMVYGRSVRDRDFGGMYCAILTVNSTVVTACTIRIFGQDVAELPLIATLGDNKGQGLFTALFSVLERLLGFLNVKTLVLPAADKAESVWTGKFGFNKMTTEELSKIRRYCQLMTFQGTLWLQKTVPSCRIIAKTDES